MDANPPVKTEKYDQIRSTLKTGDIVLFSSGVICMKIWKRLTGSRWTHVGIVVYEKKFKQMLLWESVMSAGLCDVDTYENKKGVQSVLLRQKVRGYKGEVAIRRLTVAEKKRKKMRKNLREFRKEVRNRDYEKFRTQILKAFCDEFSKGKYQKKERNIFLRFFSAIVEEKWGLRKENIEDLSSIFCSELIAEAYQRMGLLKKKPPKKAEESGRLKKLYKDIVFHKKAKPSNEYTPDDFSSYISNGLSPEEKIQLVKGVSLSDEIGVVY